MRLAFCIHTYAPVVGGSETLVGELARRLAQRGHQVGVYTSNASSTQGFVDPSLPRLDVGECMEGNVTVVRLPYIAVPKPLRRLANLVMQQFHAHQWPGYGRVKMDWVGPHLVGLNRSLRRFCPDRITAAAHPFAHMRAAQRWARRRGVPYVALPCLHPQDPWAFDNPYIEAHLQLAEAVVALTPYERDYLVALGVDPTRVHVLGLGIDPPLAPVRTSAELKAKLGLDPGAPMVLFLGRKEEHKGVSTLVAAARSVWDQGLELSLVLAGPETSWSRGQHATLTAGLNPQRFCYLDEVAPELKDELLWHCDIVALPSRAESFGIVFLEGWARGKPVIGGRTGATCSLVKHGEDGLLVSPGDASELAEAMRSLIANPARAVSFGNAGRRKALAHFRWEVLVDRTEALYRSLASSGPVAKRRAVQEGPPTLTLRGDQAHGEPHAVDELPGESGVSGAAVAAGEAKASVLVVSYNGGTDLLEAVSSALGAGPEEVLVVDNGSSDGAPSEIRRRFPQVRLLELSFNAGFAGGNNRGLRIAQGDFVVLLNQDATLDSGALTAFAEGFSSNPQAGILAPRILVREEPRVLQSAGLLANQILYASDRGYLELDGPAWRQAGPVIGGSGAALALRRAMLDHIGLFDPALFMYYEDLDLCLRAWLTGWQVSYVPGAVAYHRQRVQARSEWLNEFLDHRNRQRLLLKTFSGRALVRRFRGDAAFQMRSLLGLIRARRWNAARLRMMALLASTLRLRSTLTERRTIQALRRCSDGTIENLLDSGWSYPKGPPAAAIGPMQPAAERLDFSPAGSHAFSLGWHGPERDESGWYRWMGSYGLAFLSAPSSPTELRLRTFSLVEQRLAVWVGSKCIRTIPIKGRTWEEHLLRVGPIPNDVRLLLIPEHACSPAALGLSEDSRELGLACSEFALLA